MKPADQLAPSDLASHRFWEFSDAQPVQPRNAFMRRPTHRTPGWAPPVKLNNPLTAILLLVILATLVSCSGPRATSSRVSPGVDVVKGELPQVRYYITNS